MRRINLSFIIFLLITFAAKSQIGDIKKEADRNTTNNSSYEKSSTSSSSDPCMESLFSFCFSSCTMLAIDLLSDHHNYLLKTYKSHPRVVSFEFEPGVAFSPDFENFHICPKIKGTWGVLGTEARYNALIDFQDGYPERFTLIEWQIIQLNIMPSEYFNLRVGTGFVYEEYQDFFYNENYLGLYFHIKPDQMYIELEGRNAYDYAVDRSTFSELALSANFAIFNFDHLTGTAGIGGQYQNYYETINLLSLTASLNLNIH